jgi:hypothetical protein
MYYAQTVDGVVSSTIASQAHYERASQAYFKALGALRHDTDQGNDWKNDARSNR